MHYRRNSIDGKIPIISINIPVQLIIFIKKANLIFCFILNLILVISRFKNYIFASDIYFKETVFYFFMVILLYSFFLMEIISYFTFCVLLFRFLDKGSVRKSSLNFISETMNLDILSNMKR
jgi:hypothetical protein